MDAAYAEIAVILQEEGYLKVAQKSQRSLSPGM